MKSKSGITLVALVITIIVLLILVGVSIYLTIGNNGILSKTKDSVTTNKIAIAKEDIEEAWESCETLYWEEWTLNSSIKKSRIFTKGNLDKFLDDKGFVKDFIYNENDKSYLVYVINETNEEYRFLIDNQGKVELKNKTITFENFENDYTYNDTPVLCINEEFEFESIKINGNKLDAKIFIEGDEEEISLDVIKDVYSFDCLDCSEILGYDEVLPGIIIDTKSKIINDFSKCDFNDSYYVIAIYSDEDLSNILNGNYFIDYGFWVGSWLNTPNAAVSDLLGYHNLVTVPYWCSIVDKTVGNSEKLFDIGYSDEEFEDAIALFEEIKNTNNVSTSVENADDYNIKSITCETDRYIAILSYTIGYEDSPAFYTVWENGKGTYNYYLLSTPIYDLENNIPPYSIRNKTTKSYEDYSNVLEEIENSDNPEDIYNKYEYYREMKFHILKEGKINLE